MVTLPSVLLLSVVSCASFSANGQEIGQGSSPNASLDWKRPRSFYVFPNLFLGAGGKAFGNYKSLIDLGERYASYFQVKTVDSERTFGMPKEDMYAILVEVNKLVNTPQFDHNPNTWKQLAPRLTRAALDLALVRAEQLGYKLENPSHRADFEYFVKLTAIQEWVRSRVDYDYELADAMNKGLPYSASDPMTLKQPITVCGGQSWYVALFAKLAGLDNVYKCEGSARISGNPNGPTNFSHSWNVARLPSQSLVFADITSLNFNFRKSKLDLKNGRNFSPFGFGIEPWQSGFFLYYYHSQTVITGRATGSWVEPTFLTVSRNTGTTTGIDYFTSLRHDYWHKLRDSSAFRSVYNFYTP